MSVTSILPVVAALTATSPVAGDFDGDGATDSAAIISKADREHEVVVTFADGRHAFVSRVDGQADIAIVAPERIATLCEPIVRYMPDCTRKLEGRDRHALWIKRVNGPAQGLAVWNGTRFAVVTSLWPENAASATSGAASAIPRNTAPRLRAIASMRSILELDLSPSGKAESCRIIESSGAPDLDIKACSIMMKKAKFKPMSGVENGKRSTTRTEIVWRTTK